MKMPVIPVAIVCLFPCILLSQNGYVDSLGRKQGAFIEVLEREYIVREASYVDGLLEGPYVVRYKWDKGPLVISRGNYRNGRLHGLVIEYDADGRVKATWNYKSGLLDGIVSRYTKGRILMVERYENGMANGLWQTFHKNGRPKAYWYCHDNSFGDVHYLNKQGQVFKIIERKRKSEGPENVGDR